MRKVSFFAIVGVSCLLLGTVAYGSNDCCWDWAGGAPKATSPGGWAQCTPTPKGVCFDRPGLQAYLPDYTCVVGSDSPDDPPVAPDTGNGFGCVPKLGGDEVFIIDKARETTPVVEGLSTEADIPTVSQWGLLVMVLLVLAAGTLVIRRAREMKVQA